MRKITSLALLLLLCGSATAQMGSVGTRPDRGSKTPFGHARTANGVVDGRLIVGNRLTTLDNSQNANQPSVSTGTVSDLILLTVGTGKAGYGTGGVSLVGTAAYPATMAGVSLVPRVTLYGPSSSLSMFAGYENAASLLNAATNGANTIFQTSLGFYDHPFFSAPDGQTMTIPHYYGFYTTPSFGGTGSGTLTAAEFVGLLASPNAASGGSVTAFKGVSIPAGSVATTIGLDFEAQTGATLSAGLRCASTASAATRWCLYNTGTAPLSSVGGLRLGDNTAPTNKLEVSGGTTLDGAVTLWPNMTASLTSDTNVMSWAPTGITASGSGTDVRGVAVTPTISLTGTSNVLSGFVMNPAATIATSGVTNRVDGLYMTGTVAETVAPTSSIVSAVYNDIRVSTQTVSVPPPRVRGMTNTPVIGALGGVAVGTVPGIQTLSDTPQVEVTDSGTSMTVTNFDTVDSAPILKSNTSGAALTITTRRGLWFLDPTYTTTGTVTVNDSVAVDIATQSVTSGNRTVSNVYGIRSALTATSGGTTKWLIGDTGGAGVSLAGDVYIGSTTLTAASAKLHVQQQTAGSEVFRAESVATSDDPNYRVFQQRAATTNATATALHTFTTASDRAYLVEARVVGRCTSGSGCTAGQALGCIVKATVKNVGGTATVVAASLTNDHCVSDITGLTCTTACTLLANTSPCATATNICIKVAGLANQNITWHDSLILSDVGS